MTDHPEIGSIRIDTSFTPHSSGQDFSADPIHKDRYSRHSNQNQPRIRDVTWISTSQSQPVSTRIHTPQTPRYVPPPGFQQTRTSTPVLRGSPSTITEPNFDGEYMTVSVDDHNENSFQRDGHFTPHSSERHFLADPFPLDRYSRHSGQNQPRVRDVTWISTSQSQPVSTHIHTPQTPRYVPTPGFQQTRSSTPVLRNRPSTTTDSELDAEYMTVTVDDDHDRYSFQGDGRGEVISVAVNERGNNNNSFLRGFVSGLRRLPKDLSKSKDNGKPERHEMSGTAPKPIETGRTVLSRHTDPSLPGRHNNEPPSSEPIYQEEPGKSGRLKTGIHSEVGDSDLLEVDVRSSTPGPQFNYDESLSSVSSAHSRHDEVLPHDEPQSSIVLPAAFLPETHRNENPDVRRSSLSILILKWWKPTRIKKSHKDPALHELDRVPREPDHSPDSRSPSLLPARADATIQGPSWMAAGKRKRRAVAKSLRKPKPKSPPKIPVRKSPSKDISCSKGPTDPKKAGPAQPVNDVTEPSARGVHLTRESGKAILRLSIAFPGWMCCGSSAGDGTHSST